MPVFEQVIGQELALAVLRRALQTGPQHAYLFAGPPGVGKTSVAFAFAAGLICADGGCNACETCRRVKAGVHPDLQVVAPEGPEIRIEQIREVNSELVRRPFEGARRVFLILEADAMNAPASNGLLRTLEEPPPHVHFVLVTDSPQNLLPTIISRCQKVPFRRTSASVLSDHLRTAYGLSADEADAYARVAQGSLTYARSLATDEETRARRESIIEWAVRIPRGSFLDLQRLVDEIMQALDGRTDSRSAALEAEKERRLQWEGDKRVRDRVERTYDMRIKRERRRAEREGLEEVMRVLASWYRDLAVLCLGGEEPIFNRDRLRELHEESLPGMVDGYLDAVSAVRRAEDRFRYNVDARISLKELVLSMKEALL